MFVTFIRYFTLIACSFYIYLKLLNLIPKKKSLFFFLLFITIILPTIYYLKIHSPSLIILILVFLFALCLTIIIKTQFNLSLTTSIFSFGISYFIYLLSSAFMSVIGYFIFIYKNEYPSFIIMMVFICVMQFLLTPIPFFIKRFKNGIPSLKDYGSNDNGGYLSILLLLAASFSSVKENKDLIFIIPVSFIIICGLSLFFWWRSSITKKYMEKIKAREIKELNRVIEGNETQLEQLRQNNEELSKIIHKDNKLIPAMEYAVREYISTPEHLPSNSTASTRGKELLEQLACLTQERTGILTNYETNNKKLNPTGILSIDTLLSYMSRKAGEHGISFDVSISDSITQLTKNTINEVDLRTLLADLIDNAIIATKNAPSRNILIRLGVNSNAYSIDIFDSGELFQSETLSKIGLKRTTTHGKEGGSGIGLMTTFELIKKCQASFVIEELPDSQLYTKKVGICYDTLSQFRIKTTRNNAIKSISNRSDILLTNNSSERSNSILPYPANASI